MKFVPSMLYVNPAPKGDDTVIFPVFAVQTGGSVVITGIAGVAGAVMITAGTEGETQPSVFFTLTLYAPDGILLKMPVVLEKFTPSMLYDNPVPTGEVTVIFPVLTVQVGGTIVIAGAVGVTSTFCMVAVVIDDMQPAEFLTVTL